MNHTFKKNEVPIWASIFSILIGIIVITGWVFKIPALMSIVPDYASMKFNTALFFLFSGIIGLTLYSRKGKLIICLLSTFLIIFSFFSLLQDIVNIDFRIDQLFITDNIALVLGEKSPGRPSPVTSLCFSILGISLLLNLKQDNILRKLQQCLLHTISFLAFIAILGYLFNVPILYKLSFFTSMAIHTSIGLFFISIGLSYLNPKLGITGLLSGNRIGNIMAKTLFIRILSVVIIFGFIILVLLRSKFITPEFAIPIFISCFVMVSLYGVHSTAQLLNSLDIKKEIAEQEIIRANRNLEEVVAQRTKHLSVRNRQLLDFSYIVSHNLRGPTGNLETLLNLYQGAKENNAKDEVMKLFKKTVSGLRGTLNELLDVIALNDSTKNMDTKELCFEQLLQRLLDSYSGKIKESKTKVTYDFSKAPKIRYQQVYLKSIMENFLSNALKYRSHKRVPEIHFTTDKIDTQVILAVSDNGLGIDMEKVGEKLFGLRKTFHEHPEAKGVGLFMTKAQIQSQGGEIVVESEIDKGTTFKVYF
jgi:signal transduction histidine kinase